MALTRPNVLSLPTMNESWAITARNYEKEGLTEIDYWCSPTITSTDPARHAELAGRMVQVALEEYSNIVLYGAIKSIEILTVEETFERFGGRPEYPWPSQMHQRNGFPSGDPRNPDLFKSGENQRILPLANIIISIKPIPAYLKDKRGKRPMLK